MNFSKEESINKRKRLLGNLKNTYCRLKPSNIEGVGVFAIRDIPQGVNPLPESNEWLSNIC